jgi:WD40 repeat protein
MAEQEQPVRRRVALKIIKLGMDTKQVVARFEAERQALALMDHPSIAKVLDAGATDTGRPYFVMELVRGMSITRYCDENQLDTIQRLRLFILVCQAIQHAHQKGIIHRDIKPSNILVADHDGTPVPKVIDFGIAKATVGQALTDKTLFTAFEQFIGTPTYMSPEQAKLSGLDIDTRSDIYSLGVLLYELLTGRTPFDTKWLIQAGLDEVRRIIQKEEPPRPSTRLSSLDASEQTTVARLRRSDLPKLVSALRGDLDWIIMKSLDKERARRYETANGLARDIQRHLDCEPVLARPPSRLYEFQKTVRRHKVGFGAAATVCLALLLGLVALAYGLKKAKAAGDSARAVSYASDLSLCWQRWMWSDYASCRRLLTANLPHPGERDLRSFEWWYLWRLCRGDDLYSLGPVPGNIRGLAFLPGGRLVAGAAEVRASLPGDISPEGSALFVWDWKARHLLATVKASGVNDIAVTSDGRRIAVAGWDNTIRILDGVTYAEVTNYTFTNMVQGVDFSPDGKLLAIRGQRCVYIWDVASNAAVQILPAFENKDEKPAFSPDGRLLVFMLPDGKLGLWDVHECRFVDKLLNAADARLDGELGLDKGDYFTCRHAFSPNGKLLASGDWFGRVMVHDLEARTVRLIWEHFSYFTSVTFSPDGKTLASTSYDGIVKLWDPLTGKEVATCQGQESGVHSIAFAPDGDFLLSGGLDGCIRVWDARPSSPQPDPFQGNGMQFNASMLATQGSIFHFSVPRYYAGSPNGRLLFWPFDPRPPTPSRHDTIEEFNAGVERALSVGARFLVFRRTNGPCHVMDLELGLEIASYTPMIGESIGAISPDGRWVAASFEDGRLLLREPLLSNARPISGAHSNRITALEFSPTGTALATAACDGWLKVWDPRDLGLVAQARLPGDTHFEGPTALAFARDGTVVACGGSASEEVLVLELAPLKPPHGVIMPFSGFAPHGLAFSPDGRQLAVCGYSDRAAVFDARSGRLLKLIGDGSFLGFQLAEFTPDNRRLALASSGAITLWDLQSKRNVLSFTITGEGAIDRLRFNPGGDRLVLTVLDTCKIFHAPNSTGVGLPSARLSKL